MNELALFAGAGGGILGGKLLGWRTIAAVEWDPYPASVLIQRQNEGFLPPFPVWDDVQTFDGKHFRGLIDVVSGGFPCQDISVAGKRAGIDGERSSMWYHMLRIINDVQPMYAFIENSHHLRTKGLTTVLQGLAEIRYNAAWGVLSAKDCGANHERKRMWILAKRHPANTNMSGLEWRNCQQEKGKTAKPTKICSEWFTCGPNLLRMDDGMAFGMDRLKALGNGQVPIVAATAFTQLKEIVDSLD